ncbi:MAG: M48 family metallopeptidase [Desulfobacterales bacterium]|nr:M48 family metallopeptidase [Desulfobacterales bacterium]
MKTLYQRQSLFGPGICLILLVITGLVFIGCAEVPITGRGSLHLVPDSELMTMSLKEYRQVIDNNKLSTDPDKVRMVRKVGNRISKAAEAFLADMGRKDQIRNYQWEFNLIQDDKVVNAWVMPGGKAAVYTGILPYTKDENGLAVVLGHEVGHAIAEHGNERMSQALLANMGAVALSAALAQKPDQTRQLFMTVYGVGTNVGVLLPYSRLQESEADRIGLMLMARAGYDPRAAVPFWERMNREEKTSQPEFLSTHPAPSTRIADIERYIPEAMPYYRR